jgi:hypothetical protein
MNLSDISRQRTLADLEIARARILDLTVRIGRASVELQDLRGELAERRQAIDDENRKRASKPAERRESRQRSASNFKMPRWIRLWSKPKAQMRCHVDEICGDFPVALGGQISVSVDRNKSWAFTISGWLVPQDGYPAFKAARLVMTGPGGAITRQVATHIRDDVGAHFGNREFALSGFRFDVPMSDLEAGKYSIDLIGHCPSRGEIESHLGWVEFI